MGLPEKEEKNFFPESFGDPIREFSRKCYITVIFSGFSFSSDGMDRLLKRVTPRTSLNGVSTPLGSYFEEHFIESKWYERRIVPDDEMLGHLNGCCIESSGAGNPSWGTRWFQNNLRERFISCSFIPFERRSRRIRLWKREWKNYMNKKCGDGERNLFMGKADVPFRFSSSPSQNFYSLNLKSIQTWDISCIIIFLSKANSNESSNDPIQYHDFYVIPQVLAKMLKMLGKHLLTL